jgi:hypothetical protein
MEGLEGQMEGMRRNDRPSVSRRLAAAGHWMPLLLVVAALAGALMIGLPALLGDPSHEREQLQGFFGLPEEMVTESPTVVLVERVGAERIVTVLPGGMATKARTTFAFSSRVTRRSEVEDVNGDQHLDLVVDGVILYNVGGEFTLQPPTPTPTQSGSSESSQEAQGNGL